MYLWRNLRYGSCSYLPQRCARRRMGVCRPVSVPDARRCAAAGLPLARPVQRPALPGPHGLPLALPAARHAAVGGGLPAVDPLAGRARVRGHRARFERVATPAAGTPAHPVGRRTRRAHVAEHARKRAPRRLGRGQAAQGQQGPHRRRHAGPALEHGHHTGQRAGSGRRWASCAARCRKSPARP